MKSNRLHALFMSLQQELTANLTANREALIHPVAKGDGSELKWREMLDKHLPARYQVSKGFVIDAASTESEYLDLIIHDRQYSPLLFNMNGNVYVPAESVYAVFEIKQEIDKDIIKYAGDKIASVRRLGRTSATITHAGGVIDKPKKPFRIVGGILALDSSWKPPFGDALEKALSLLESDQQIDLGCVIKHGSIEVTYSDQGTALIEESPDTAGLIFFFLRLLERLQKLGTVPAMDLREYGRSLESPPCDDGGQFSSPPSSEKSILSTCS